MSNPPEVSLSSRRSILPSSRQKDHSLKPFSSSASEATDGDEVDPVSRVSRVYPEAEADGEYQEELSRLQILESRFGTDVDGARLINLHMDANGKERYLLKTGVLKKSGKGGPQRHFFILLSSSLVYCVEGAKDKLLGPVEVHLRNMKCLKGKNDREFHMDGSHPFTCIASSRDERDEWVASINSVLFACHPSRIKEVIVFQNSLLKLNKKGKPPTLKYFMLLVDERVKWGVDRSNIIKETKILDVSVFEKEKGRLSDAIISAIPQRAHNRFLALYHTGPNPLHVILATRQQRDFWLDWWFTKHPDKERPPIFRVESKVAREEDAKGKLFTLLMSGNFNGISADCLQILKEVSVTEFCQMLPLLVCSIAATPFWIRGQCNPIVDVIKEKASAHLIVAQMVYACYHSGFLDAHPDNSLAFSSWCGEVNRRGDICTALKHVYQRAAGYEYVLEPRMEAYHPFTGYRVRRLVIEKVFDEDTALLTTSGLLSVYCFRIDPKPEPEEKRREHSRKTTRVFAPQGSRLWTGEVMPKEDKPSMTKVDEFRTVSMVLKVGSSLRYHVAFVHIAEMFNIVLQQEGIGVDGKPVQVRSFGAVAFTTNIGVVQFLSETVPMRGIRELFHADTRGTEKRKDWEVQLMCTGAGAYLIANILGLRERNDTNVLIQTDGTVVNVGLGDRFLSDGNVSDSANITQDFKAALGDANWELFVDTLVEAFVALRKNIETLMQFCTMMLSSCIPAQKVAEFLQVGFMMDLDLGAACVNLRKKVEKILVTKAAVAKPTFVPPVPTPAIAIARETPQQGNTALVVASEQGQADVVEMLLSKKADPNQPNEDGRSPLMAASEYGQEQTVRILLRAKADVKQLNKDSSNALILGSAAGMWNIVRILLEAKADPSHSDKHEENAMYWAAELQERSIVALLESLGVEPPDDFD